MFVRKPYGKRTKKLPENVREQISWHATQLQKNCENCVVEQMTSLAARACVNVRIGEFMLGNSRTKLPVQCMLRKRGQSPNDFLFLESLCGRFSQCWEWPALHGPHLAYFFTELIYRSVVYNVTRRPDWLANFSDWIEKISSQMLYRYILRRMLIVSTAKRHKQLQLTSRKTRSNAYIQCIYIYSKQSR